MKIKYALIGLIVLFLAIGSVSAAENISDTISITNEDPIESAPAETLSLTQDEKTITAYGDLYGYSLDEISTCKLSDTAKKQFASYKAANKNNKVKYTITLTSYQYNKLANAKMIGTYETISFDTNQYVIVKKPVIKKTTKLVYSKKFSSYKSYKKAYDKLYFGKYYGSFIGEYKFKVKKVGKYRVMKVYKTTKTIKYFKNSKQRLRAYVHVNARQCTLNKYGHDCFIMHVNSLGLDGTIAHYKINTFDKYDCGYRTWL